MKQQWILAVVALLGFGGVLQADIIDSTAGLVYHLEADSGVTTTGSAVSAWADTTGNYSFAQNDTTRYPTLVANAVNGHSALQFTASAATQLTSKTACTVQTIFIVCKTFNTTPGNSGIWGQYIDGTSYTDNGIRRSGAAWLSDNGNCFGYGGSTTINGTSTLNDSYDTWEILAVTATSAQSWTGSSVGNYFAITWTGATTPDTTSRAWSGDIAELAAFSGALTTSQINAIGYSLAQKYGITTTYAVPEPSTMLLLGSGLLALPLYIRRRRKI